jgi:hypothetical protein
MHRLTQLSVKESTNRIVKRCHQAMSLQKGLYGFNANPELMLEYQPSILSSMNESAAINAQGSIGADTVPDVADTEEGIKRYTQKTYAEIMDVIHSIVPRGDGDFDDRDLEEIKGYHMRQMRSWQNQMTQANLRGGGGNLGGYLSRSQQQYAYQTRDNSSSRLSHTYAN